MSEWEEKLQSLLSDPDSMAQVMQLAQSLSGRSSTDESATPPPSPPPKIQPMDSGFGDITAALGGIDPMLLKRLLPVVGQLNRQQSGESAALLYALRPFLREERRMKVERAVQLARLIHLAKTFLTAREG